MNNINYFILTLFGILISNSSFGQMPVMKCGESKSFLSKNRGIDSLYYTSDTSEVNTLHPGFKLVAITQQHCKSRVFTYVKNNGYMWAFLYNVRDNNDVAAPNKTPSFLAVHGSIMYQSVYQSNIDTPYISKDIYQHTIQAGLDVTVKDKYPLKVFFTTRFGNYSLIKNITDINVQFNNVEFGNKVNQSLERWGRLQLLQNDTLNRIETILIANKQQFADLNEWLSNPQLLRNLLDEKKNGLQKNNVVKDSSPDSTNTAVVLTENQISQLKNWPKYKRFFDHNEILTIAKSRLNIYKQNIKRRSAETKINQPDLDSRPLYQKYKEKKKALDSLQKRIDKLQQLYVYQRKKIFGKIDSVLNNIKRIKNPGELSYALKNLNLPDSVLPKGYMKLLALKSLSLGRSNIDYSELSVKNISIKGGQFEYNPSYYFAVAAGTIDYRFRDFVINDNNYVKQYVGIVRFGTGRKDGNHFFVSYYSGRKQLYNYGIDTTVNGSRTNSPGFTLMGISVEKRWQLNKSSYLLAEVAKSSLPLYNRLQNKTSLLASTLSLQDRSNEAFALKLVALITPTHTKINAYYKHFGANFQSFNLFSSSSTQEAWFIKVDQPFFNNKLLISSSIKKNDFTNPYVNQNLYSSTVFKSISTTLRVKKWPVISIGYYPSSQLTKMGNGLYFENLFYTFSGSGSYVYHYHSFLMNSILTYTRFYNNSSDSGFVYYNTSNFMFSQTAFLRKTTLQFGLSRAQNSFYKLYTIDGNIEYKMSKFLALGAGLKYNRQTVIDNIQVGYSANAKLHFPKLGDIEFVAQKGFIPGVNRQLVENNIGRLIYYKLF